MTYEERQKDPRYADGPALPLCDGYACVEELAEAFSYPLPDGTPGRFCRDCYDRSKWLAGARAHAIARGEAP